MNRYRTNQRRGATIVIVAITIPFLLMIIGFSVDLAYMQQVRTELRAASDLAAKAASVELADTGSTDSAIARGKEVAALNLVGGSPLILETEDFVFGKSTRSMTDRWTFFPGEQPHNAVEITATRSDDQAVKLFFSRFVNNGTFEPSAKAVASFIDVDVCLVLDRSSSMKLSVNSSSTGMSTSSSRFCVAPYQDSRWVALESAVNIFIDQLELSLSDEKVAVVTFASNYSNCGVSTPASRVDIALTSNLQGIRDAMADLSNEVWNGNTEIDDGIADGTSVLTGSGARSLAEKVMIVLTDGNATGGSPVPNATAARSAGITVHTITYGAGANQNAMINVATAGGGDHFHAPDEDALEDVFRQIAGSISILTE